MRFAILPAFFLLLPAIGAHAAPVSWHSLPDASRLDFTARWQGTPVAGEFRQFTVAARLDPKHPAGGQLAVRITTAGISAQSADVARALRSAAWFDVKHYPRANFDSQTITARGGATFEVTGTLKLKGHSKTLSFPLTLTRQDKHLILDGRLTLQRTDFGIGNGQWSSGKIIAIPVTIVFHVVLGSA